MGIDLPPVESDEKILREGEASGAGVSGLDCPL